MEIQKTNMSSVTVGTENNNKITLKIDSNKRDVMVKSGSSRKWQCDKDFPFLRVDQLSAGFMGGQRGV